MAKRETYTHEVTLHMTYGVIIFPISASYQGVVGYDHDGIVAMLEELYPAAILISVGEIEDQGGDDA